MPKPTTPLVLEFCDLDERQRTKLGDHPASIAPPIQSREDSRRWIVSFAAAAEDRGDVLSEIEHWARRAGIPKPRRRA